MIFFRIVLLALAVLGHGPLGAADFLAPEKAFAISAQALDGRSVDIAFRIAPGYYMYREAFRFSAEGATLGEASVPPGHVKFDDNLQKEVETHRGELHIRLPVQQAGAEFQLRVIGQGCADQGLCYPPMPSLLAVSLQGFGGDGRVRVLATGDAANEPVVLASAPTTTDESSTLADVLQSGNWWAVIGVFFVAGVLLSLTPCVLPMLPILSSIIAGQQGGASRGRGLLLAASYSLGMALVYTAFGIAAGLVGEGLAAMLQTPLVLGAFAALLVLLSLSMFGLYELRLPAALTGRLAAGSQRLQGGRVFGVFVMGGLSALIVSPCVAAPLAGALVYLSQTRDVLLGGSALFALALGMSVPLLLLGASAGALLPRAGAWMEGVKRFFGLLLLAVALWLLQPLLPAAVALLGWGGLLLAAAVLLWPRTGAQPVRRMASLLLGAVALLELVGAASGGHDPLMPLSAWRQGATPATAPAFQPVRSVAELDAALANAGRPVMLDFYADWCVSCKEMERFTFRDPAVQARLSKALLLKADVTANTEADRALLRRFQLFGPPGTIFFDGHGQELRGQRVIGFQSARRFERTLEAAGL
jgi:thiol:disulfide interchange protein DsbD